MPTLSDQFEFASEVLCISCYILSKVTLTHARHHTMTGYLFGTSCLTPPSDMPTLSDQFRFSSEVLSITCSIICNVTPIHAKYYTMTSYLFGTSSLTPPLTCLPCQINLSFHLRCHLLLVPSFITSPQLMQSIT